jgi:hypothetical protein
MSVGTKALHKKQKSIHIMSQDNFEEVSANSYVKFNKIGDHVVGYLLRSEIRDNNLKPGEKQTVYTLRATGGNFHDKDGSVTEIQDGSEWNVSKDSINLTMQKVLVGAKVKLQYTENIPSKKVGMQDFKNVRVFISKDSQGNQEIDKDATIVGAF